MLIRILFWSCVSFAAVLLLARLFTELYSINKLYSLDTVPESRVAIVFGAGLQRDGSPSPILRDRVETAAQLYLSGKVEKLLMSGDNRFVDYNEPGAMRAYALSLGVPEEDIVLDYAGRRTFDTCYRAKIIFGVDEAILVTQKYHITRALFTCNGVGLKSAGVPSDVRTYRKLSRLIWNVREMPATVVALWDVWISHPAVVLGDPEPIFSVTTTGNEE
ncbi:MAG: ElyC/SanA/YdcF family protein [Anaerolineaceae bacterium]|nr:ElyC/SanA/YdcF family protein [Anaerolineaceae bacterium]